MNMQIHSTNTKGKRRSERIIHLHKMCFHWYGPEEGPKIYRRYFKWLEDTDFFEAPASTRYHGAYPGGLYDHSCNVASVLLWLTNHKEILNWEREVSPLIIGMLHDATKIGRYVLEEDVYTPKYKINPNHKPLSFTHGIDSVLVVSQHFLLTDEEAECIQYHMGAYEINDWPKYDEAIRRYPNVLWTHTADMIASKLMEEE